MLVFLPPQSASAHLGASEISHRKKNNPQHIWRLTLKSADNISMEIKYYDVDNEFSCWAFPSRGKKATKNNTSKLLHSALQLCYWLTKNTSISHHWFLMEMPTLRSQDFNARCASIHLENQIYSWGTGTRKKRHLVKIIFYEKKDITLHLNLCCKWELWFSLRSNMKL